MFYAGSAVSPSSFFNRRDELFWLREKRKQLFKDSGQPLALVGLRKAGKTSLLRVFLSEHSTSLGSLDFTVPFNPSIQVFIDFLGGCLCRFLSERGIEFHPAFVRDHDLEKVILELAGSQKNAEARLLIKNLQLYGQMQKHFRSEHVEAVLEFPAEYWAVQKKKGIVVWDEFQNILNLSKDVKIRPGGDLLGRFREVWQNHPHILYIICGSEVHLMDAILNDESSAFFSHFQQRTIGPFSEKDIITLFQKSGHDVSVNFSEEVCHQYYQTMGGIPFYAQVIGDRIVQLRVKKPKWRDFQYAFQIELWDVHGRLFLYFQNLFDKVCGNSSLKRACLLALSEKKSMIVKNLSRVIQSSTGSISNALSELKYLLDEEQGAYSIRDPAFRLWMSAYHGEPITLSPFLKGNEAELEVAHDLARYGIHSFFSRGSRSAIDLLIEKSGFHAGLQVKKASLPAFIKKAEWLRLVHEAGSWNIHPLIAIVEEEEIFYYDAKAFKISSKKGVRLDKKKCLTSILSLFNRPQ